MNSDSINNAVPMWYVHPYAGGPGVGRFHRGYILARLLADHGIDLHIVTSNHHHQLEREARAPGSKEIIDGVTFVFLGVPAYEGSGPRRLLNMVTFGTAFRRYLRQADVKSPVTIVYSSPHLFGADIIGRICRKRRIRFILEVRDLWPLSVEQLFHSPAKLPFLHWLKSIEQAAYRRAKYVVSLLPDTRDYMVDQGMRSMKWRHIPNGVFESPSNEKEAVLQTQEYKDALEQLVEIPRRKGRRVLLYTGQLGKPNNMALLLRAMQCMPSSALARLSVGIIGRGSERESLVQDAKGLPVLFHDYVSKATAHALTAKADGCFVAIAESDIYRYGISVNKIYDYMLVARPIIAAYSASNDPVIEAGAGWNVSDYSPDKLAKSITTWLELGSDELARIGNRGREWVLANHDYRELANLYLPLLLPLEKHSSPDEPCITHLETTSPETVDPTTGKSTKSPEAALLSGFEALRRLP